VSESLEECPMCVDGECWSTEDQAWVDCAYCGGSGELAPSVHSANEAGAAPSSPKSDISTPASLQHTLNRFMGIK
jgi:hypothetical protein